MNRAFRCGACALLLALAGCATQGVRVTPSSSTIVAPAAAEQTQNDRRQWLAAHRDWRVSGRVAISRGGKGGSGRLDWAQAGDAFTVSLSAPITRQSWRLTGSLAGGNARIEGLDGGPREGDDAEALLREATGWDVPVNELSSWIAGIAAPGANVDEQRFGDDGLLARLRQAGWTIDYARWNPPQAERPALPARIEAVRDDAKVRLIVDEWDVSAVVPVAISSSPLIFGASNERLLRMALSALNLTNPAADMRANVARDDRRAIGICGYSCSTPGMPEGVTQAPTRRLAGTSDVIESEAHQRLMNQAEDYAVIYNVALGSWLKSL